MDIFITPFLNNGFLLNALFAGTLVAIACGIVGTFMVLRGLAFLGDALAHGVLPGVASALLWGIPGFVGASVGSLVMIAGITWITKKSRLSADTAIGLLFVGMLASGVVIVSHSQSFSGDLVKVLFGQFLGISSFDLVIQSSVTLLLAVMAFVLRRPFLLLCFSEEQAQVSGYSAKLFHFLLLVMIALTVIVSFQTVGTLLVFGMLLAPCRYKHFSVSATWQHDDDRQRFRDSFGLCRASLKLPLQSVSRRMRCVSRCRHIFYCLPFLPKVQTGAFSWLNMPLP